MRKIQLGLLATALVTAGTCAADEMKHDDMMAHMKAMDTNHDGMISRQEFTKHHNAMWAKMKKNKSGKVGLKDMAEMHGGAMKDPMPESTMKDGGDLIQDKSGKP